MLSTERSYPFFYGYHEIYILDKGDRSVYDKTRRYKFRLIRGWPWEIMQAILRGASKAEFQLKRAIL